MKSSLAAYIHVPFCLSRCFYCDFYSSLNRELIDDYLAALLKEIALSAEKFSSSFILDTIYFGGGTPSLLSSRAFDDIIMALDLHYGIKEQAEISFEANPCTVDYKKLRELRALGLNRLSLGVQSFNLKNLSFLGRRHSVKEAVEAIEAGRKAGFSNISLDMIYGLPEQSLKAWEKDLDKALSFSPEHLSLYMLSIEESTPLDRKLKSGLIKTPEEGLLADIFSFTLSFMEKNSYPCYEISNFARSSDFESRHNKKYWNKEPYLGFGPSAHSFIMPLRWSNISDLKSYISGLKEEKSIRDMEEHLGFDELVIESFYLGFRRRQGLDIKAFEREFQLDFMKKYGPLIEKYQKKGFLYFQGDFCSLSPEGMLFLDAITGDFISF